MINATFKQRINFAVQHMMAASRFAQLCYKVEQDNTQSLFGQFYDEVVHYVTATVLFSVASIEANINEIFADMQDGIIVLDTVDMDLLSEIWRLIEAKPILEKYQLVLLLKKKNRMAKGEKIYQNADTLIRIRNAYVHFKPEWIGEQKEHEKLGQALRNKFDLSPFLTENDPIFPMRCMTHGFAEWAVESSLGFVKFFSQKAELPNRYEAFLTQMNTK